MLTFQFQKPILFRKYLSPHKSQRNGSVFKICVWISVFRRKKRFVNPFIGCRDMKQTRGFIVMKCLGIRQENSKICQSKMKMSLRKLVIYIFFTNFVKKRNIWDTFLVSYLTGNGKSPNERSSLSVFKLRLAKAT